MRKINEIIVHCSSSPFGDAEVIGKWHKLNGWVGIGYHWVVLNGYPKTTLQFDTRKDGAVEKGRDEREWGAHCYGHNKHSIGICIIGKKDFSKKQYEALDFVINELLEKYDLSVDDVRGHYELNKNKTCPNIDMTKYRARLKALRRG